MPDMHSMCPPHFLRKQGEQSIPVRTVMFDGP